MTGTAPEPLSIRRRPTIWQIAYDPASTLPFGCGSAPPQVPRSARPAPRYVKSQPLSNHFTSPPTPRR